jgi:hypothetical protein
LQPTWLPKRKQKSSFSLSLNAMNNGKKGIPSARITTFSGGNLKEKHFSELHLASACDGNGGVVDEYDCWVGAQAKP